MKRNALLKSLLLIMLALAMVIGCVACGGANDPTDTTGDTQPDSADTNAGTDTTADTDADTDADTLPGDVADEHTYDFYITLGTMPTLYATLNAYARQNPNTYMWFLRGNTISKEYSADFIHYFSTQSSNNNKSSVNWAEIRDKVKEIKASDPEAKFHLYCDDMRVALIPHIFVYAGVEFEDLRVTLLSDGTGTYHNYYVQSDTRYNEEYPTEWNNILKQYVEGRDNEAFEAPYADDYEQMTQMQYAAFYLSTFSNVDFWIQNPEYLTCASQAVAAARENMNLIKKDPAEMYQSLPEDVRAAYQKVVLANALVDSDTLKTLEDAVTYFDSKLSGRDKELVLILGTNKKTLDENKFYIDATLAYYTPTVSADDATKVLYKGQTYDITAGDKTVTVDGKTLTIGELGVYLFFKGHPAHPADETLQGYFAEHGIEILPHRTPVETLFWMYDVKAGGYESTSFLSCYKGQTEFLYEQPTNEALVQMKDADFFDNAAIFEAPVIEETTGATETAEAGK